MTTEEKVDELLGVLTRLNQERGTPVDESVLRQIIALVLKNPLNEDRGACQDQIYMLLQQQSGGRPRAR